MNTLYVRCQTKDYILDIVPARAGIRINKVNSVKKAAFPQHNISNAEYKEILIIIYKYNEFQFNEYKSYLSFRC